MSHLQSGSEVENIPEPKAKVLQAETDYCVLCVTFI